MAVNLAICWVRHHSKVVSLAASLLIGRSGSACVCVSLLSTSSSAAPAPLSLSTYLPSALSLHAALHALLAGSHRLWPVLAIPPSKSPGLGLSKVWDKYNCTVMSRCSKEYPSTTENLALLVPLELIQYDIKHTYMIYKSITTYNIQLLTISKIEFQLDNKCEYKMK